MTLKISLYKDNDKNKKTKQKINPKTTMNDVFAERLDKMRKDAKIKHKAAYADTMKLNASLLQGNKTRQRATYKRLYESGVKKVRENNLIEQ